MAAVQTPFLQSFQGPSDGALRGNAVAGYTQVSRVGESVVNAFVDSYEYGMVPPTISVAELKGEAYLDDEGTLMSVATQQALGASPTAEAKPHFYEWCTAYTGMIAVQRRQRSTFRAYVAAETAAPVIVCAAGKNPIEEFDFQFAGVVRSNSVRTVSWSVDPPQSSRC